MGTMARWAAALAAVLAWAAAFCGGAGAQGLAWVRKPALKAEMGGKAWRVTFEVSRPVDVEVAIVDPAASIVVRHLAAGVLGPGAPGPLAAGSCSQAIAWDGRDDYGVPVPNASALAARVRAGMGVSLKRIVGGDPYAYYSREMAQGDHAIWKITGLEAKPDGKVYVLGNSTFFGPPALRQYDANGTYLRTVFPPPAGKPVEDMTGWGIYVKADGTYGPKYNQLSTPALTTTIMAGERGSLANLLPSAESDRLVLWDENYRMMAIRTDGTIAADPRIPGRLVNEPSLFHPETNAWKVPWRVAGPVFTCLAPDGKSFYLSGVYAATVARLRNVGAEKTGFWRDGQVFRVDLATRTAKVFFALPEAEVIADPAERDKSPIGSHKLSYSALHGVAVDRDGHVFVCDRQHERLLVLDADGRILRELAVSHADSVAPHPTTRAVYVVTRDAAYMKGNLGLVKFDDWTRDTKPAVQLPLGFAGDQYPRHHRSFVAACEWAGGVNVWVAYQSLPVRVYRDKGDRFELVKDFYQAGPQRCLDLERMKVDRKTEHVYIADGFGSAFRLTDWRAPKFVRCMMDANTPVSATDLYIDSRNRHLYTFRREAHGHEPVVRYRMDGKYLTPAPVGQTGSHVLTQRICNHWTIGEGHAERGFAVAPDGSLAVLGGLEKNKPSGELTFFKADPSAVPWAPLAFASFGAGRSGGAAFDLRGNLYVGKVDGTVANIPEGFAGDRDYAGCMARIYQYAPTGSPAQGGLFPTAPSGPSRIYDVPFGTLSDGFCRSPRFSVDEYGRIWYPTSLAQRVAAIDNAGNEILHFGTYGNRDSMGGLPGDLAPTSDIPLAYPNSVDATDDFIYVTDMVNLRLLRIAKTFALVGSSR